MTIKSLNNLADNLNLDDSEILALNALIKFFYSEGIGVSEPSALPGYYSRNDREDNEYEWIATNSYTYIGSLHFGRKHQYSPKKFYWIPNEDLDDYFFVLTECVPEQLRSSLWTEKETNTLLYSTSDARSECRTY